MMSFSFAVCLFDNSNLLDYTKCVPSSGNSCIVKSVFNKSYDNQLEIKLSDSNECGETVSIKRLSLHDIG